MDKRGGGRERESERGENKTERETKRRRGMENEVQSQWRETEELGKETV